MPLSRNRSSGTRFTACLRPGGDQARSIIVGPKENPEGYSKAMPAAIDKFKETDPSGWTHKMAQTFMATVHQSGLASILETLSETGDASAKTLVEKAIGILNAVNQHAEKSPERDLTPESQEAGRKRQRNFRSARMPCISRAFRPG